MRTIVNVDLIRGSEEWRTGFAQKTFDLPFAVPAGMEIWTSAWKEGRKVKRVSLNLTDEGDFLYVEMESDRRERPEAFDSLVEAYKLHGWAVTVSER